MYLFLKMIKMNMRATMKYKSAFFLETITSVAMMFSEFFIIYLLVYNAGDIGGWSPEQLAFMYVITMLASSLESCFSGGLRGFSNELITGNLDTKLLRPVHPLVIILSKANLVSLTNKLFLCGGILTYITIRFKIAWTLYKVIWMFLSIIGGGMIFLGLATISAALSFWTYDSDSFYRMFKNGTRQILWYPIQIYDHVVRSILTFVIPLAFVGFYPTHIFIQATSEEYPKFFFYTNVLIGAIVIGIGIGIWNIGIRKYESTG